VPSNPALWVGRHDGAFLHFALPRSHNMNHHHAEMTAGFKKQEQSIAYTSAAPNLMSGKLFKRPTESLSRRFASCKCFMDFPVGTGSLPAETSTSRRLVHHPRLRQGSEQDHVVLRYLSLFDSTDKVKKWMDFTQAARLSSLPNLFVAVSHIRDVSPIRSILGIAWPRIVKRCRISFSPLSPSHHFALRKVRPFVCFISCPLCYHTKLRMSILHIVHGPKSFNLAFEGLRLIYVVCLVTLLCFDD
jgi:hypothetical protein